MKSTSIISLIALVGLLLFSACQKGDENIIDYVYAETQCADPWGDAGTNPELRELIKDFLEEEGIDVISIEFSAYDGQIYCQACSCPSGRDIELRAAESFANRLEGLGFEQQ